MSEISTRIADIVSHLPEAMPADRVSIRRTIERIKRSRLSPEKRLHRLIGLEKKLAASMARRSWRKDNLPPLLFNADLPIFAKKDDIIVSIQKYPVVVISGDTGSGKSTQIPKFCLAAGRGVDGMVGCTQPRRIAATSISRRIAEELGEPLGQSVGYKIRFRDRTRHSTFIKIMTDGILLSEAHTDPYLNQYDTLIIDEAHERSLNIDFILGMLKRLMVRRKDLKLIITSATIDTEKFSDAFGRAPVIEVSGRMYPVELRYLPETPDTEDATHIDLAVAAVDTFHRESPFGDILIFMPTEQDIRETSEILQGRSYPGVAILPLFARLSAGEQSKVFSRISAKKIIVATNVAETSITIPGIRYVVDTGLARISQYSPRTRTTALPVTAISKSSADQRKGRCGRVQNGVCLRLYSADDYETRIPFTPPEILRSNLAEVILRMISLRLGAIEDFPFIDKPAPKHIQDGFGLLRELDAIASQQDKGKESAYRLTDKGKVMASLPIDPRLSRILIQAAEEDCLPEVLVIAAALSIPDPRERPVEKQTEADEIHRRFSDPDSDFITLLNIWKHVDKKTASGMKRFCTAHFLSYRRMREWQDIHAQLQTILEESDGFRKLIHSSRPPGSPYPAIHRSLLSGFLSNIAEKKEQNLYKAARGKEAMIFPGSSIFGRGKQWIMAAEMVETTRLFARNAANIESGWLEEIGKELCTYIYKNARWDPKRGEVLADQQVSLYGLIVVAGRSVRLGPVDPEKAADIFVREALVAGNTETSFEFLEHNQERIGEIEDLENRLRRRDLLIDEEEQYRFYRDRLKDVFSIQTLRKSIRERGSEDFLKMTREHLLRVDPDPESLACFPDTVSLGNDRFECDYRFIPGASEDGLTIKIPFPAASKVPPHRLDWLVPGLLKEKIELLLKNLPKGYRRRLAPLSKTVDIIADEMPAGDIPLVAALSRFIAGRFGVEIPAAAWSPHELPDYLKMRIALIDSNGKQIQAGRDLSILTRPAVSAEPEKHFDSVKGQWERDGIVEWDFGDLPEWIEALGPSAIKWVYYPALHNTDSGVCLRLFRHHDQAVASHKEGVGALLCKTLGRELKFLQKRLLLAPEAGAKARYFGGERQLRQRIYQAVITDLLLKNIRTRRAFRAFEETVKPRILETGQHKLEATLAILDAYDETRTALAQLESTNRNNLQMLRFIASLRAELANLVPDHFLSLYGTERLHHLVRYVKALAIRAKRAAVDFEREKLKAVQLGVYTQQLKMLLKGLSPAISEEKRNAIEAFYWLVEEYKVSLFAQELKTAVPVSPKRLDASLREIEMMV